MDALMKNLSLNPNIILYRSVNDAVVHFDKICRTCLSSEDIKCILDVVYENMPLSVLLEQHVSIKIAKDDLLPKHICDNCIVDLIKCYHFKTKCLLSEKTLDEIVKYNENRKTVNKSIKTDRPVDAPFVLQHIVENDSGEATPTDIHANVVEIADSVKDETINVEDSANTEDSINTEDYINLSDYENDIVVKSKPKPTVLKENVRVFMPVLKCNPCGISFKSRTELIEHRKEEKHIRIRKTRTCPICAKVCYSGYFKSHLRTHNNERPFKCKQCSRAFSNNNNLKRHMMIHTGERPFICEICGKGFNHLFKLQVHQRWHFKTSFTCTYCSEIYTHVCAYRMHMLRRHSLMDNERKTLFTQLGKFSIAKEFPCNICDKVFHNSSRLWAHKLHHRMKTFLCSDCDKSFYTKSELDSHAKIHTGERAFCCSDCGKSFTHKANLKTHSIIHGTEMKTFLCSDCGKSFHRKYALEVHAKTHTGERPFLCLDCGKTFTQQASLKTHSLIHTGERSHVCPICSKSFVQSAHLKYHLLTHSEEKSFVCSYCSKGFRLKGTLTVHKRIHTGEKPFVCDICGKGFHASTNMTRHKRFKGHFK